jgi:hypothetical protein
VTSLALLALALLALLARRRRVWTDWCAVILSMAAGFLLGHNAAWRERQWEAALRVMTGSAIELAVATFFLTLLTVVGHTIFALNHGRRARSLAAQGALIFGCTVGTLVGAAQGFKQARPYERDHDVHPGRGFRGTPANNAYLDSSSQAR